MLDRIKMVKEKMDKSLAELCALSSTARDLGQDILVTL